MPSPRWTTADIPDQDGRVVVVTGANSGIGYETARALAVRGATVVLAVRDVARGAAVRDRITAEHPGARALVQSLDLGSLDSVRAAAHVLRDEYSRIDLLINNAGVMHAPRGTTQDGFEQHFGVNHLGHFALTGLLLDRMVDVPGARVVTVSSADHRRRGPMPLDDVAQRTRGYDGGTAYSHSKLANLLFTYELQRRLAGRKCQALAAHPGGADTEGSRVAVGAFGPVGRVAFRLIARPLLIQTAERGAWPTVRAATDPAAEGGQYYGPDGFLESSGRPKVVRSSDASYDTQLQRRLWDLSEKLTGVAFPL
ncbi:oxidoreductase [Streptomyces sp. NPDC088387]|uniref:oxidoreductase n=1 Tax=Streptomyces sp. NPDC088387 TaxID=3365859 RepID=UPI0037FD904B